MKIGDLVQIRHNEHHGLFVVIGVGNKGTNRRGCGWWRILSLKSGGEYHEMGRSLEVISESG